MIVIYSIKSILSLINSWWYIPLWCNWDNLQMVKVTYFFTVYPPPSNSSDNSLYPNCFFMVRVLPNCLMLVSWSDDIISYVYLHINMYIPWGSHFSLPPNSNLTECAPRKCLSTYFLHLQNVVIPAVESYIEAALSVIPATSPILLERYVAT